MFSAAPHADATLNSEDRIEAALVRARRSGFLWESALALAAASALATTAGLAFPARLRLALLAAAGGAALAILRAFRGWDVTRAARAIERQRPALADGLLAWIGGGRAALRPRLGSWLASQPLETRHKRQARAIVLCLAIAGTAIALRPLRSSPGLSRAAPREAAGSPASRGPVTLSITAETTPPGYARRPAVRAPLPPDGIVSALAGSRVSLVFGVAGDGADALALVPAGGPEERIQLSRGTASRSFTLARDIALRVEIPGSGAPPRIVSLRALPDLPPEVELREPRADATINAAPAPFAVEALARDDIGLASAGLWFTLAHGRGEGMSFKNGAIEAAIADDPTGGRRLSARVDPSALGMKAGDTLILWAEASDFNDVSGPGISRSAARVLRWEEKLAALDLKGSASTLKIEDLPLSQRELLARTLRFIEKMTPMNEAGRREKSLDLADDQRKIRERYGQFTRQEDGTAIELDVEEKESADMGPPKILRLLVKAVDEMWASELALSASDPRKAVPHQRLAVKYLEDAFGLERYALRALAAPRSAADQRKRLTGDAKGLDPRFGPPPSDPSFENAHAALRGMAAALFLAADSNASPRALGDAVFGASPGPGFDPAHEAASFYSARSAPEAGQAARALALRLLALADSPQAAAPPAPVDAGAISDRLRALTRATALPAPPAR